MSTRVLVPSGVLGLGFDSEALAAGVQARPDIICIDGGSTDSGPYYLGTGTSKYSRAVCKSEWRELMLARAEAGVPLVIGSSGTCGTDSMVDWMLQITSELAAELNQQPVIVCLYSEQPKTRIEAALADGAIDPLAPTEPLDAQTVQSCTHIVALAGCEQINAALALKADIVIAGRTTDTAIIASLPLTRGEHPGACWHAAKIAECGALCSTHPTSGVIMVDIDKEGFTVEAMATEAQCTPHSVSAHMLYENADPYLLHEPGGHLDVSDSHYEALAAGRVRVTGSSWTSAAYTVKLEGVRLGGYQTVSLVLLREERYVRQAREWRDALLAHVQADVENRLAIEPENFSLEMRLIGDNAVLAELDSGPTPREIGALLIVTAKQQSMADEIARLANPQLLHFPLTPDEPLPTFAFPFSPAETSRGALYEFCLHHTMRLSEPMDAFRLERIQALEHSPTVDAQS